MSSIYLYNEIREFCTEETKDIVCPQPVGGDNNDSSDDVMTYGSWIPVPS